MATEAPALAPAAPPTRPRTVLVGMAFTTAGIIMFFGVLVGIYVTLRQATLADGETWIAPGTISLVPGTMMAFTMAMSVATAAWAVRSVKNDDRVHAYLALGITAVFGISVVNQTVFLYNDMGLAVDQSVAATLLYVITGAHLFLVLAGVVAFGLIGIRVFAGQYGSRQSDGVAAAAMLWYAAVGIYLVIWYVIYVTK